MRILWVSPNFLHPTTKGGQIRTLEILKRLHSRHEVHYVAFDRADNPGGPERAGEYSARAYAVPHDVPAKQSAAFALQLTANLFSPLPLAVSRYRSPKMAKLIEELLSAYSFNSLVCDFLFPAPNFARLNQCVLFQHNVETMIWRRHFQAAYDPARRWLFHSQAKRMFKYERETCLKVRHIVAVSEVDARRMEELFGVSNVTATRTGVDTDFFTPPPEACPKETDLVFLGSMDWLPNVDGVLWFASEVLPRIRKRKPETTFAIVGRTPSQQVVQMGRNDDKIMISGTVPDVRPYLWRSRVCVVPLRIGGGTRLKIYEAMAARTPVVSTTTGAEGLALRDGHELVLADSAEQFAAACLRLLDSSAEREALAGLAWQLVRSEFSWERVAGQFEEILEKNRLE